MKMTGAIFDMDGTLLDSMPIWDRALITLRGWASRHARICRSGS